MFSFLMISTYLGVRSGSRISGGYWSGGRGSKNCWSGFRLSNYDLSGGRQSGNHLSGLCGGRVSARRSCGDRWSGWLPEEQ
jgi:hypothetical protein